VSETLLETVVGELAAILASLIMLVVTTLLGHVSNVRSRAQYAQPGYTAHEKAGAAGDAPAADARDTGYK